MLGGLALALAAAGCGQSGATTVTTADPARAFAPVVHLARGERFMPMDARWFLERSSLWFAEDMGCEDRKIAVGRRLKAQRTEVVDYMFITGVGWGPAYWREAWDRTCDRYRERYRYYANQLTRPLDDSPDRAPGLHAAEGYYLDLMDWAREGPDARGKNGQLVVGGARVFFERDRADVDGDAGLRLTYWMLFGMNRPLGPDGQPVEALIHEGDWERVEILLREGDGADEWEPVSVRFRDQGGGWREVEWSSLRHAADGGRGAGARHPVFFAARGSHTLYPRPGRRSREIDAGDDGDARVRDIATGPCAECVRWDTWRLLRDVRKLNWYGFGGAWGQPATTAHTTGPLGPHGEWAKGDPADDFQRSQRHADRK